MINLIRIEWLKVRTTRSPWFLLLAAVALVIAGVSGISKMGADLASPDTVGKAAAHVGLVSLLSLVLGILIVGSEYRHKTITDTYLSTPRRTGVVAAKAVVATAIGFVFGVVSALTAALMIILWWKVKGVPLDLTNSSLRDTLVGGVVWNAAFAALGVALGALLRNVTAAIAVALAWIAVVEGVVGQLVGDPAKWLPFASGTALGKGPTLGSYAPILQWQGAVALALYALAFFAVAVSTTVQGDVT